MISLACETCGAPMAAAEAFCAKCGAAAPAGKAALLQMARAEQAWEAGDRSGATAQLERALKSGLPQQQLPLAWRKLGVWLEKEASESGKAELLARAGQAFKTALSLNDADEMAHQLFIANWGKQGLMSQARDYYQARLQADAADAVALKQLNVIKLSADFLAMRPPSPAPIEPQNALERWLKPSPWKVGMAGLTLVSSVVMVVVSLLHAPATAAPLGDLAGFGASVPMPISLESILYDPGAWALQGGFSALLLYFMYRSR